MLIRSNTGFIESVLLGIEFRGVLFIVRLWVYLIPVKFQEDLTQYDYKILKEFVKEREENKRLVLEIYDQNDKIL